MRDLALSERRRDANRRRTVVEVTPTSDACMPTSNDSNGNDLSLAELSDGGSSRGSSDDGIVAAAAGDLLQARIQSSYCV